MESVSLSCSKESVELVAFFLERTLSKRIFNIVHDYWRVLWYSLDNCMQLHNTCPLWCFWQKHVQGESFRQSSLATVHPTWERSPKEVQTGKTWAQHCAESESNELQTEVKGFTCFYTFWMITDQNKSNSSRLCQLDRCQNLCSEAALTQAVSAQKEQL